MTFVVGDPIIEEQPCGCKTTTYKHVSGEPPIPVYEPCLSCALVSAGQMIQQAGMRIRESIEAERAEIEKASDEPDTLGASD